jgi:hypothetical protein
MHRHLEDNDLKHFRQAPYPRGGATRKLHVGSSAFLQNRARSTAFTRKRAGYSAFSSSSILKSFSAVAVSQVATPSGLDKSISIRVVNLWPFLS